MDRIKPTKEGSTRSFITPGSFLRIYPLVERHEVSILPMSNPYKLGLDHARRDLQTGGQSIELSYQPKTRPYVD